MCVIEIWRLLLDAKNEESVIAELNFVRHKSKLVDF